MKWSVGFLVVLGIFACITPSEGIYEDTILGLLEEIRVRMCHPLFGLPPLDPFHIDHMEYEGENKYLSEFSGSITNLNATGLSDFKINDLTISIIPFRRSILDLTLPLTRAKTLYSAHGWIVKLVKLAGEDIAFASIEDFNLQLTWILNLGLNISIRSLTITIKVGDYEVDLGKLIEEERINDFLDALLNELGGELVSELWTDEKTTVVDVVQNAINNALSNVTPIYINELLNGYAESPFFGKDYPPGDCKDLLKQH